ncbi:hypothetical protein Mth01_47310 [Sphaerimonospora thailandensis]|uniref:Uncharacterized protein n=1 Tax=Sphaerimonospora thailandensis TaxID=795644 RepID=A0A8J3RHL6_9ACTN|nr:hypothetical protein Mth01_47310 [Sphaerimonospora thailandensis]
MGEDPVGDEARDGVPDHAMFGCELVIELEEVVHGGQRIRERAGTSGTGRGIARGNPDVRGGMKRAL